MKKTTKRLLSFLLICLLCLTAFPAPVSAASELKDVQAAAAILVDISYDTVLYEKNSNEHRPPASITKVMTALMVLEALDRGVLQESTVITASANAPSDITDDSSTQNIQPGEQMTVANLLYCLLIPSANEAANILAEAVSGSVPSFVEAMNARAAELGMTNTHFMNPHGLHNDEHYSTAHDIYLMVKEAMKYPLFQKIVSTQSYTIPATNLSPQRKLLNTNALLTANKYPGYTYDPVIGVKTGHTPEAGYCLASAARKNERTLIAVVLGAENITKANGNISRLQFSESRRLLRWGFENFKHQTILSKDTPLREVNVKNGKGVSHVIAVPLTSIEAMMPTSFNPELLNKNIALTHESVYAPVKEGQVLGSVTVSYEGKEYGTVDLVASNTVDYSMLRMIGTTIASLVTSIWVWLGLAALFVVIFVRYLRALRRTPRRKQKNNKNNIQHIDSAKGIRTMNGSPSEKGGKGPKKPGKPPR